MLRTERQRTTLALVLGLTACLSACVVVPPRERHAGGLPPPPNPTPVYNTPPPVYSPPPVYAPAPTVQVVPAPPPLRSEQRLAAPAAHWFWVDGHWRWDGQRHQWEPGRWVEPRHGESHVGARWVNEGGTWVYHPARWERVQGVAAAPVVMAIPQPPPRRSEAVPPRPGPGHFWIDGHWRWERNQHVWVSGHWERERQGERWTAAQWKLEPGGRWTFVEGYWSRR
jgi:hypothetical protein